MSYRLIEFDIMRSFAILFIVITHMHLFYETPLFNNHIFLGIGDWGLVIFFFISGFLLNHNNKIENKYDIITFLKKRVKRIYPLYLISLLTTFIMFVVFDFKRASLVYDLSVASFAIHIMGLQGFIPDFYLPNHTFLIPAMWYISCILWYYLLYSILIYYSKNIYQIIIYSCLFMFPFILLYFMFNLIQYRMFYYYPSFVLGIVTSIASQNQRQHMLKLITIGILLVSAKVIITTVTSYDILDSNIIYYFLIFIGIMKLKLTNYSSLENSEFYKVILYVSYCSYSIYLFHFPILCFVKTLLDNILITQGYKSILFLLCGVPLVIIISYNIQKQYDFFIKN